MTIPTKELPPALVRLADAIADDLPRDQRGQFSSDLSAAIGEGKDLSRVHWAWLAETLRTRDRRTDAVNALIDLAADGMDLLARGFPWPGELASIKAAVADVDQEVDHEVFLAEVFLTEVAVTAINAALAEAGATADRVAMVQKVAVWESEDFTAEIIRQRDSLLRLIAEAPRESPALCSKRSKGSA